MAEYAIFKMNTTGNGGKCTISFESLPNPAKSEELLKIDAVDDEDAVKKACNLLKLLGVKTHSRVGDYDLIMTDIPDYYVGRLENEFADKYDTLSLAWRIHRFIPVEKSR